MDNETAGQEATSTQKKLLSCHDPGWNDPPKWAISGDRTIVGTPTKRLLNKRVAFPLSPSSSVSASNENKSPSGISLPGNLPPLCPQSSPLTSAPHAPFLAPTPIPHSSNGGIEIDRKQALNEAMENLESVLNKELAFSDKTEEVRRRLDAMKIMWEEDKLKDDVHDKVLRISKALSNNDVDDADKIHISLMMDHAALCNTWISGIRHIILELREKLEKTSREEFTLTEKNANLFFLPHSVEN